MRLQISLFLFLVLNSSLFFAQNDVNQFDDSGKRHGVWKKFYPGTQQLRYEGAFEHGKEVGVFKFYCEECKDKPTAIKKFEDKGNIAHVKYFTIKGKLVSEGSMEGKDRIGEWIYYHEKSNEVMTREFYAKGELDGAKITYYLNGEVTEELQFVNGKREGKNDYYAPDGVLIKKLKYKNDFLQGEAVYYDAFGNVIIEGYYKEGKKHGLWKYYKDGKLVLEETYPKPKEKRN